MPLLLIKNVASALAATTIAAGAISTPATGTVMFTLNPAPITQEITTSLDIWLDDLAELESHGQDHIKILDVNGRYSYGCLQFQMNTFWNYGTKYDFLSNDDKGNLGTLIYDCELQKAIAKSMIQDNPGNWRHWYTSVAKKKLGPPPTEVIADATK